MEYRAIKMYVEAYGINNQNEAEEFLGLVGTKKFGGQKTRKVVLDAARKIPDINVPRLESLIIEQENRHAMPEGVGTLPAEIRMALERLFS